MTPDEAVKSEPLRRVSVLGRLVPAFSYGVSAPACVVTAILLFAVIRAFKAAKASGLTAGSGGIVEANSPIRITLVFAIAVGLVAIVITVVRPFTSVTAAPPSAWFFLIGGLIGLAPLLLLWKAESLLIQGLVSGGQGVIASESSIRHWLTLTIVFALFADIALMTASIAPLPAALRAKRKYTPLLILFLMEAALIGMAVAFQARSSWLQQQWFGGRL